MGCAAAGVAEGRSVVETNVDIGRDELLDGRSRNTVSVMIVSTGSGELIT